MDDNAQVSAVPTSQTPSDQTDQSVSPAVVTPTTTPPQAASRPVQEPNKKQQISVGGHPEQGSVFIDTEEDDDEEEQQVAKQEIRDHKETPMVGQTSHPEVILPPEVKEAGVEKGADGVENLPEEQQKLEIPVEEPVLTEAPPVQSPLPLPYDQAVQAQKVAGSPKNARKWWLTEVIREWKKRF
ncbi:MAG TPA: hypothetical protein VF810_01380 [Patescibacteria group bacterium]